MSGGEPGGSPRPICVLGAGRSGTSLATRVVNLLGVEIGPEEAMRTGDEPGLPPSVKDLNPSGFWELREVSRLNEDIMSALGGSPPPAPSRGRGWERDPAMVPFRARAEGLIERYFDGSARWAFKDPLLSFTVPLWRTVAGEFDFVVCVRNPLEVAASIEAFAASRSGGGGGSRPTTAWLRNTRAALAHSAGCSRTFVFHEEWESDPPAVVARLARFLFGPDGVDKATERRAMEFVKPELRRQRATDLELAERDDLAVEVRAFHFLVRDLAAAEEAGEDRAVALQALIASMDS